MKQFSFLLLIFLVSGCATQYHASDVSTTEISNIEYFGPISYIYYVEKGNKAILNDSLSRITTTKLDSLFASNKQKYKLSENISVATPDIKNRIENEVGYLADQIERRRYIDGIPLTPTIDSILDSRGQRFGLVVVATGFGRAKGNFGGQVAKGIAVGILTMGMVVPTASKSQIMLRGFIFDAKDNNIAFYRKALAAQKEPNDSTIINKQLVSLFEDYLYDDK